MQHDGWLETYLQARFPGHKLVIRNLGFSGDELTLRLRSANFGTPDQWLTRTKADVVFAFFGYNESFAGKDGLAAFKKDLDAFVKHTLAQKYNGKSAPRLVLFSPIAMEAPRGRDLPDPSATNERLELYTAAMAEVARADGVAFVDLFAPTSVPVRDRPPDAAHDQRRPLERARQPRARRGDHRPALPVPGRGPTPRLDKLRQAVLDKNFYWFNRYRTVDGYSIFGGRADLSFTDGQTNRVVAQREMEVLDVMTANRDKRIWAVAQGKDLVVDDSNTPPFIPVKTNKPGAGPNGEHLFLGGEEAIGQMTVGKNLKVNLFASEKEFPELAKPVQMSFDSKGRLWVACWPTYPHWKPKEEMNDKLLILEDTDGDGKADKKIVFAGGLHCPTGFRVRQRRRLDRPGARPDVLEGHQRRRQGRRPRARSLRPRLGRHAPHLQQLPARPRRRPLFSRGNVPPDPGRDAVWPAGALLERGGFPLRAEVAEVRRLRLVRLRQPARPRLRPLGPGYRGRRHRVGPHPRHPVFGPRRLPQQARRPAPGLPAAHPAHARHRVSRAAATSPRNSRETCSSPT